MTHIDAVTALAVLVVWTLVAIPLGMLLGKAIRLGDPERDCDDREVDR